MGLLRELDFELLISKLNQVGHHFFLLLFTTSIAYLFATLAWKYSFKDCPNISLWELFCYRHIGEVLALLNPSNIIAGETLKTKFLCDRNVEKDAAISSIVISRCILVISSLVLLVFSTVFLLSGQMSFEMSLLIVMCSSSLILIISNLVLNKKLLLSKCYNFLCRIFPKVNFLLDQRESVHNANLLISAYAQEKPLQLLVAFCYSSLHWFFGSLEFYLIFLILDSPIGVLDALAIEMGVMVFKSLGSFVPGQIGVEEYGNKLMIGVIGFGVSTIWITVSILRRARQLVWIIIGILMYLVYDLNIRKRKLIKV